MNRDETPASGPASATRNSMPPTPLRRRRGLAVLLIAAGLVLLFHAPLLRGVWNFLVVEAPFPDKSDVPAVRASDVETVRGIVELHRRGLADRVLLPPASLRLTDELGLTEPTPVETRRELESRGVPAAMVDDFKADGFGLRFTAYAVGDYLGRNPGKRLTIVTPRLQGRYVRRVFDEVLADDLSARVTYFSVRPLQYDEARWWTSRLAVQRVFQAYLQLLMEVTTDLPQALEGKIDWRAFDAAVARGEKP